MVKDLLNTDPIYLEVLRIQKRKEDGVNAYQTTQAQLRLTRLTNGISNAIYTEFVYEPMNNVITKISNGNWLDAYNIIGSVTSNAYLTATMLLGFKNQIANYIIGDGDYTEYAGRTVDATTGLINP